MADPNMNKTPEEMKKNETMQREQGQQGQSPTGQQRGEEFDKSRSERSR